MWFKNGKSDKNVYLLIDRSGSMASMWASTLESVNGYVTKLEDDVNVFVAAFDAGTGDGYKIIRQTTAKAFEKITPIELSPRGGTALFDAAGKIMNQMIQDAPERAVLVVMTDGEENMSQEYKHADVMAKLKTLEEKHWPVVYLGAGFKEVVSYATGTLGLRGATVYNTSLMNQGATMDMMSVKTSAYFAAEGPTGPSGPAGSAGVELMSFTEEEKAELDNKTKA